jgi:hypothetical protein
LITINQHYRIETINSIDMTNIHPANNQRCTANGTPMAAEDCVMNPWNRITVPRRYALPCTTTGAPFTVLN